MLVGEYLNVPDLHNPLSTRNRSPSDEEDAGEVGGGYGDRRRLPARICDHLDEHLDLYLGKWVQAPACMILYDDPHVTPMSHILGYLKSGPGKQEPLA